MHREPRHSYHRSPMFHRLWVLSDCQFDQSTITTVWGRQTSNWLLSVRIPFDVIALGWQGSHRVWKTGKTGKKIMVREKSGNFIFDQKSYRDFFIGQKLGYFFPESLNAAISIINLLKISRIYRPTWYECISWYECEIITQIHNFGCRELSVAMIYGQGKIAKSQGISFPRSCGNPGWAHSRKGQSIPCFRTEV